MIDPCLIITPLAESGGHSPDVEALLVARDLFARARGRSLLRAAWFALLGHSHRLRLLREAAPGAYPLPGQVVQRAEVELSRIVGSEGRAHDFDPHFAPAQWHTQERWISVAVAWYECRPLPPVELIAVGDDYYVRDGHHRISVARAFGATTIDANVELWQRGSSLTVSSREPAALLPYL